MGEMDGRVCLVTGGTDGIGLETARALALMGASVVIVGRNAEKGARVVIEIASTTGSTQVEFMKADLSLMKDVRALAELFKQQHDRLHVLVNNAGGVFQQRQETAEGLEMTFALNHINYFLLTHLLLETIKASGTPERKARIVNVSSDAHQAGRVNFDDLQAKQRYSGFGVYGNSKLMNILFTNELARRLAAEGAPVIANSLHPGLVATQFGRNNGTLLKTALSVLQLFAKTPAQGADTSIYLASAPEAENVSGLYFDRRKPKKPTNAALDEAVQKRLWSVSESIAGIQAAI